MTSSPSDGSCRAPFCSCVTEVCPDRVEAVDRLCDEHDAPGLAEMVLDLREDRDRWKERVDCWMERVHYLLRTDPSEWEPEVIRWLA